MERRQSIIKFVLFTIGVVILFNWYIRINIVDTIYKRVEKEISYQDCPKYGYVVGEPNRIYTLKCDVVYSRKRTYIPFIYERDTLNNKVYYVTSNLAEAFK